MMSRLNDLQAIGVLIERGAINKTKVGTNELQRRHDPTQSMLHGHFYHHPLIATEKAL